MIVPRVLLYPVQYVVLNTCPSALSFRSIVGVLPVLFSRSVLQLLLSSTCMMRDSPHPGRSTDHPSDPEELHRLRHTPWRRHRQPRPKSFRLDFESFTSSLASRPDSPISHFSKTARSLFHALVLLCPKRFEAYNRHSLSVRCPSEHVAFSSQVELVTSGTFPSPPHEGVT